MYFSNVDEFTLANNVLAIRLQYIGFIIMLELHLFRLKPIILYV